MAKRKKIDGKKLIKMVKDGVEQPTIINEFGFKTSSQLKIAYANALMETGDAPKIKGARKHMKKKPVNTKVSVNNRGTLTISKKIIESMGIKSGETFEAKKTAGGIQLKLVKDSAKAE